MGIKIQVVNAEERGEGMMPIRRTISYGREIRSSHLPARGLAIGQIDDLATLSPISELEANLYASRNIYCSTGW